METLIDPAPTREFLTTEEITLGNRYVSEGYVVQQVEDLPALDRIRDHVAKLAARHLGLSAPTDANHFLNNIGNHVDPAQLNSLRLAVLNDTSLEPWFRASYFSLGRRLLETLVGNELAMQRRVNLSIQLPNDDSSLLPVHADVWSGDSPYEVVMWVPLVDCYRTKSMYLVPPDKDYEIQSRLSEFNGKGAEDLYRSIEPFIHFMDISFGQVLVFNQNLMHGNRVNKEAEARWSMNCRLKSVFSPYGDKKLGEFFEPITLRAATRIGMRHTLPKGFQE